MKDVRIINMNLQESILVINEAIGSHVIIKSDTLQVTWYNVWQNTFTLDNGTQISAKLLDDLEVIP